jgi:hypothetical protein
VLSVIVDANDGPAVTKKTRRKVHAKLFFTSASKKNHSILCILGDRAIHAQSLFRSIDNVRFFFKKHIVSNDQTYWSDIAVDTPNSWAFMAMIGTVRLPLSVIFNPTECGWHFQVAFNLIDCTVKDYLVSEIQSAYSVNKGQAEVEADVIMFRRS